MEYNTENALSCEATRICCIEHGYQPNRNAPALYHMNSYTVHTALQLKTQFKTMVPGDNYNLSSVERRTTGGLFKYLLGHPKHYKIRCVTKMQINVYVASYPPKEASNQNRRNNTKRL